MNYPSKSFETRGDNPINLNEIGGCVCDGDGFCERAIDRAPLVMFAVDSAGLVRMINQAALTLLAGGEGAIGGPAGEFFDPVHAEKWAEISSGLAEQNAWQGDLLVRGRDGATLMLGLSVRRIYDSKNSERYDDLYVGRDITEQKKKERDICLQEKVATRAEMAGEISHELNNYLSIAMGNLELMGMNIERGKFDNLGARIKSVREGMTRIAKFVEGLMAVPKPECRRDMFDLCQFLEDEVFYFKSLSKYQDIEFACDWGENVPAITGDRCRLQQAIYNILLNAADALSQGRVEQKRITLGVSHSQPDDMITIAISDNGPGMTQGDYQRLFRQFFSTKGQGHGFGLLAAKGAVKSFGGKVSAAPGPDGGACFTISIPGQKAAQPSGKSTMVPA